MKSFNRIMWRFWKYMCLKTVVLIIIKQRDTRVEWTGRRLALKKYPFKIHQLHFLLQFWKALVKGFSMIHTPHQTILNSRIYNAWNNKVFELKISKRGQHGLTLKASKYQKLTKKLLSMLINSVYDVIYQKMFTAFPIRQ